MKRILMALMLGGLVYSLGFIALIHHTGTLDNTQAADVIIVLGAGLLRDGRPGQALTRRSERGAELWHRGIAPFALCTGGQAESFPRSEAAACREVLQRSGVPAAVILLEERSRSTEENASYSRPILEKRRGMAERRARERQLSHAARGLALRAGGHHDLCQPGAGRPDPRSAQLPLLAPARISGVSLAFPQGHPATATDLICAVSDTWPRCRVSVVRRRASASAFDYNRR